MKKIKKITSRKLKVAFVSVLLSAGLLSSLSGQSEKKSSFKNNTSLTFAVTPIDKDEEDEIQFGASYMLAESTMSDDYVTLGGKLYYRLKATEKKEDESQELEIKRAYAKIRPFGNDVFEIALGKLYSYYLSGGFFSLTETYTGSTRWGKTGVGVKSEFAGFTFGLAVPVAEGNTYLKQKNKEYYKFNNDWGLNASLSYDFSEISKSLPLSVGASVLYSATGNGNSDGISDGDENVWSVSEKDFSECVSLNYTKRNLGFFKNLSVFAAYTHNTKSYVGSTVFKPVTNYKDADVPTNLFSLAFRPTIGSVKITSESEVGHSIEGNIVPFYTALQIYFPVYGIFALKPMAGYYTVCDTSDSENNLRTWEFYPRFMIETSRITFTAGWDMFYKQFAEKNKKGQITDKYYRWTWTVPITAKIKIGQ